MPSLSVFILPVDDAPGAMERVATLKGKGWMDIFDAALVRWDHDASGPTIQQVHALGGDNRFGAAFWDQLFGLTFFPASLGAAMASAGHNVATTAGDLGVSPEMARDLRAAVTPGTAAIFLYSAGTFAILEQHFEDAKAVLAESTSRLLRSSLTAEQEQRARRLLPGRDP